MIYQPRSQSRFPGLGAGTALATRLMIYWRTDKKMKSVTFFFSENDDTFETKFVRHVSVAQRPSSVESRIKLKLHLNL